MGRRQTAGSAGNSGVGGVQFLNTTLSAANNQDITIDPSGTGIFKIAGDAQLQAQGDLRFADADSSNWVAFQAPATISSDLTWTLPATDGSSAQVLTTNGSGTLSWSTAAVTITNETADASLHYPTFTTTTSGSITAARVTSSKLTFQPSTGTMTVTVLSAGTITETSSIIYKENINPIENGLDAILNLVGVTYDRKDGSTKNEAGLIAEDTAKILPNLVTFKDGKPDGINYSKLSAYLIEAVKTLTHEISIIKEKVKWQH